MWSCVLVSTVLAVACGGALTIDATTLLPRALEKGRRR
jgi:hypothetical protein